MPGLSLAVALGVEGTWRSAQLLLAMASFTAQGPQDSQAQ